MKDEIRALADRYAAELKRNMDERVADMEQDDRSHVLIYEVLGVSNAEGKLIDVYQNKGRFLYKYAGSFLEEAAKLCFKAKFPDSGSVRVPNTHGKKPKLFGVDCLVGSDALEIKWRDATTDGDHITKEHTRMQAVRDAGYKPVRVMFYYPNREQAVRIQKTLESLYKSVQGKYHYADAAWAYVKQRTGVDLLASCATWPQKGRGSMASEVRHGDCLEVVRGLAAESVDLVYVDPPFFTQKTHSLVTRDRATKFEFSDEWTSRAEYIEFLRIRVKEFRRGLKATGSLLFHCDTNASHHIRCLLDDVFGEAMFRSEIIWHYRRWSNSQRNPMPSHQTIFFYTKTNAYQYHQLFGGYSPSTNVDQILQRRQRDEHGKAVYARDGSDNVIHDGHKKGVPIADVWDIPLLNPKAKERVGYPTQKPILLLERIIALVTSPGDLVLDPFTGSGTTLVAAELLGRNSLGIDVAAEAVQLAKKRLVEPVKTSSELLRKGRESYVQSNEEALAFLHGLPIIAVQRNRGMDAILNAKPGENPILIRVQRRGESLADAAELLHSAGQSKQPATLVLIVTDSQQPAGLFNMLPPDVLLVNSTASELIERIADRGIGKLNL